MLFGECYDLCIVYFGLKGANTLSVIVLLSTRRPHLKKIQNSCMTSREKHSPFSSSRKIILF